jgi:hypothetical protein
MGDYGLSLEYVELFFNPKSSEATKISAWKLFGITKRKIPFWRMDALIT